ncbi:hypothetical protein TALC_01170 [Thermoplasmatales archaeon BRNA1]|nr:hypothetical protein TALC_01170 [Thermoplasmatales archaeon BRNA1]
MTAIGMTPETAMKDLNAFGFMFEALCERDLLVYAEATKADSSITATHTETR